VPAPSDRPGATFLSLAWRGRLPFFVFQSPLSDLGWAKRESCCLSPTPRDSVGGSSFLLFPYCCSRFVATIKRLRRTCPICSAKLALPSIPPHSVSCHDRSVFYVRRFLPSVSTTSRSLRSPTATFSFAAFETQWSWFSQEGCLRPIVSTSGVEIPFFLSM